MPATKPEVNVQKEVAQPEAEPPKPAPPEAAPPEAAPPEAAPPEVESSPGDEDQKRRWSLFRRGGKG